MDIRREKEYQNIKVTGPASVERVERVERESRRILLMGSTGAGKCTFIEALGFAGTDKISSNALEGFTRAVVNYRTNHITNNDGFPIYVVDTPGLADSKISEIAIVSMLQKWIKENRTAVNHLLYFIPVTHLRLFGSQRLVLKIFKDLTGVNTANSITIVTTMWDCVFGEVSTQRAEQGFLMLQNDAWKDYLTHGAELTKFHNTEDSALDIID
ncbi:hypothetical protein BJ165DRAFT_1616491 [Panaeolus papilionaceus]|nr:hypothetical protein BJ165DRAFT_1616491 [Panaeolus papilionaceus]